MTYDAIVIGGGPSAMSAALYLHRYGRNTLIITEYFGGQTLLAGDVDNYPGFKETNGTELISKMKEQILDLENLDIIEGKKAKLENTGEILTVSTGDEKYESKAVLISGGRRPRKLGIKNEEALLGRGLSYCATCDGPLSKGKEVTVIGGGYSATESALILKKIASKVTLININDKLSGEKIIVDQVNKDDEINVINNAQTTDLKVENNALSAIVYKDKVSGEEKQVKSQMVFVEIGQIPNTEGFEKVKTNDFGEIVIDPKTNKTSVQGVFASGDITDIQYKQIIVAAGEGAKAAISINKYLQNKE